MNIRIPAAFATALVVTTLPLGADGQTPAVQQRIQRVEHGLLTPVMVRGTAAFSMADRMSLHQVPGVSVAVINDGRVEWARGYGLLERGTTTAVDTATLFQAASISKPVAAMAALRLVEQGRLSLDADINTQLKSWKLPENTFTRAQPVTLRRLLSHNAGTTVSGFPGYASGVAVPTTIEVLNGTAPANTGPVRVDTTPGAIWRYSGGGTTIVQLLMQDASGQDFPTLMRSTVLQPANMVHSGYEQPLPASRASAAATAHRTSGQPITGKWHTYPEMFAAGLWTTPSDVSRLLIEVQRSLRGESNRILSKAMTEQMLTLQAGAYGLGFGVGSGTGWSTFSHGGSNAGFRAFAVAFADRGQGAVIMTNSDNGGVVAQEVLRAIAREYNWPTFTAIEKVAVSLTPDALAPLAGKYVFQTNGVDRTLTVRVDGASLKASGPPLGPPTGERALHASAPHRFFVLESNAELRFERDASGAITSAVVEGGGPTIKLTRQR